MSLGDQPRPVPSRRKRRIARRRREILDAAARVFGEKGYTSTTTRELAEAADIAEGTLYNYFENKRAILLAIVNETESALEHVLQEAGEIASEADMVALVEHGLAMFVSQLPFARTLFIEAWTDDAILQENVMARVAHATQMLEAFVRRQVESGRFRPVDPELATKMVLGMFLAPILPVLRGVAPTPSPEELHALAVGSVSLLLDGIRVR